MIFDQMVRKGEKTSPVNCICNNYVYEKTTVAQGRDKKKGTHLTTNALKNLNYTIKTIKNICYDMRISDYHNMLSSTYTKYETQNL